MEKASSLAIMVTIGCIGTVTSAVTPWRAAFEGPVTDGVIQPALEAAFDEAVVIRDGAIHAWQAFLFGVFGQMSDGALAGEGEWLFTTEEFETHPDFDAQFNAQIARILDVEAALRAHGVALLVALIPDKARIMSAYLPRADRGAAIGARYDAALGALQGGGVAAPDLRPVLSAMLGSGDTPFLRTDTHWTPEGARAAAYHLALLAEGQISAPSEFVTLTTGTEPHTGDLMRFANTGPFAPLVGPHPEDITTYSTVSGAVAGDFQALFGEQQIPVVLVGSSYSANPRWNFEGFLKTSFSADILNVAQEGRGPFAPMERWLQDVDLTTRAPDLVIWEIPERYLTLSTLKRLEE
ncbi:alginate O-acetyltransferase AlgX-related protein [Roseinatronobacter sp. NSM]|uniref:alginate O-acetyltransferase AlgX-related protein n=1 Tax=Roseinatronobacter sp. NSM TaxID=3457785 RepID=UPI0040363A90